MIKDWQEIIDSYLSWIKDNTVLRTLEKENVVKIIVPFMDRHNDHLEIYVFKEDNRLILTDDGNTIRDLKMSGLELSSEKRKEIFQTIVNGFGIQINENNHLYVEATSQNIGQKKHSLIQAILSINDMYVLSQESVASIFKEDVERYFDIENIVYTSDVKIIGKSGFYHNIDFIVPSRREKPEKLIRAINMAKKSNITNAIFAFNDIREARKRETENIVIYNDVYYPAPSDSIQALHSYGVYGVPWSEKDSYKEQLLVS